MSEKKERLKKILMENSIFRGEFELSSGKKSDYYIDARLTTLHPEGAYLIGRIFLEEILKDPEINAVGGPTMGADPIVGSILSQLGGSLESTAQIKGFLVRKEEKAHGRAKLIEGNLKFGDKAAVVEDVVTTGGSVLNAIRAVEDAGAAVKKVLVVVDREEDAREKFKEMGYEFFSIFRVGELV